MADTKIKAYTDGACSGNPGKGGWGVVLCLTDSVIKLSGYNEETTNNRMELTAAIKAMSTVLDWIYKRKSDCDQLEIVSDSSYVVNAINQKWLYFWKANGFINSKGEEVKNLDLWNTLEVMIESCEFIGVEVKFTKVKGHSGDTLNEMADKLATDEIKKHDYKNKKRNRSMV